LAYACISLNLRPAKVHDVHWMQSARSNWLIHLLLFAHGCTLLTCMLIWCSSIKRISFAQCVNVTLWTTGKCHGCSLESYGCTWEVCQELRGSSRTRLSPRATLALLWCIATCRVHPFRHYNITKAKRALWLANSASTICPWVYAADVLFKAKRALCDVAQFVADSLGCTSWVHDILTTVMTCIVGDKSTVHAKPYSICFLPQYQS